MLGKYVLKVRYNLLLQPLGVEIGIGLDCPLGLQLVFEIIRKSRRNRYLMMILMTERDTRPTKSNSGLAIDAKLDNVVVVVVVAAQRRWMGSTTAAGATAMDVVIPLSPPTDDGDD